MILKGKTYDKIYKWLLVIPALILIFCIVYLVQFNAQNGDIIYKDVSLTGGTTITVINEDVNIEELKTALSGQFDDLFIRGISDLRTGKQSGFLLETGAEVGEIRKELEDYLGYELTVENSSVEFTGATLSSGFYQQLKWAVILAFVFMALVVFIIFRTFIPSFAVILSAFADIIMTLTVVNLLGVKMSIAGIIAFLMLIGYSVDTDILLTSRVLKRGEGSVNQRIKSAFGTGMTMTLTSIVAISVSLAIIYNLSDTLRQIFSVLLIGLGFDMLNTWITNASILKIYAEKKENKGRKF